MTTIGLIVTAADGLMVKVDGRIPRAVFPRVAFEIEAAFDAISDKGTSTPVFGGDTVVPRRANHRPHWWRDVKPGIRRPELIARMASYLERVASLEVPKGVKLEVTTPGVSITRAPPRRRPKGTTRFKSKRVTTSMLAEARRIRDTARATSARAKRRVDDAQIKLTEAEALLARAEDTYARLKRQALDE